jgi:acetyl esterase/lipase
MKNLIIYIAVFFVIDQCYAQKLSDTIMNNIDYQHNTPPSFEFKLIQTTMGLFGMKKKMEKKMITNNFVKDPAKPPISLMRNFNIREIEQNGRTVWTISPKENASEVVILYLHGGAYMGNISKQHWDLIEKLMIKTNSIIVVPDYPLTPEANCIETYDFIEILYTKLTTDYPTKRIIFIGDSAGGGLAFGFLQQLRNENKKQPNQIIIFSPWLDVTMNNPDIEFIDKDDKMLSIIGLRNAGLKYAGNLDLKDYRVSPIYGDLTGLCRISIFTGTNDILNADAQKCKQLLKDQQINYNYFEYPKMFHDWVIISSLKESCDAINKVYNLVNNYE